MLALSGAQRGDVGCAVSSGFDEDALAGALLGGLDDRVELPVGDVGHAVRALGVALRGGEDRGALFHVGETVVEQGEHVGADLFAEPVTGAEILVDPDLHGLVVPSCVGPPELASVSAIYTANPGETTHAEVGVRDGLRVGRHVPLGNGA